MSSVYYSGYVRMNPEVKKEDFDPMFDEGYPHIMPKVYLEGCGEGYSRQYCFDWDDDSVVIVRDKHVLKYTRSSYTELLTEDEKGKVVWMDGRTAPYEDCWKGRYLGDIRGACEYTVEEYNLKTLTKRKYKVILDEESELDIYDYHSLSDFVDADKIGSHFKIENGVLLQYFGHDTDLVIPEGVTELGYNLFYDKKEFESITLPSTLVKINCTLPEYCEVKIINVANDNPKYYTKDGCLIDKETGILVWGYAANSVPCDNSIHSIGLKAFCNREDLENITIPDNITEVGSYAFHKCTNMKCAILSDSVEKIGDGAFHGCHSLSLVRLSASLTNINRNTFAYCDGLETIDIPNSVTTIDSDAFSSCNSLNEIGASNDMVEIIEKSLNVKLHREGNRWKIERLKSPEKYTRNFTGFTF